MKYLFLILIFGFNFCFSQEFELIDSIQIDVKGDLTDFGTDDFNNIYFIRNHSELNKIDFKTRKKKTFSNQTVLENLNTQNILQITMKSGLFNLLVLDNNLNQVQDLIPFPIESDFSPTLIALVDNNYLWGYDPVLQRLILWNYREKKVFRKSAILNEEDAEEYYTDLIYLYNQIYLIGNHQLLKFDEYGNLEKVIEIGEYDQILVRNNTLFYSRDEKLFSIQINGEKQKDVPLSTDFDFFSLNKSILFVLKDKVVYIYKIS